MPATENLSTVQSLAIEARQALRQSYMSNDSFAGLSMVEKGHMEAIAKLIGAIEFIGNGGFDRERQSETVVDHLEDIYANITAAQPTGRRFVISLPEGTLSLDDIWPEGDAPENPSPEDVIEVMREAEEAYPGTVAQAWKLIDTLYVRYHGDDNGDMEIEWNGD